MTRTFEVLHNICPIRARHRSFQVEVVGTERALGTSLVNHSLLVCEHHQFGEYMQAVSSERSVQPRTGA